MKSHEVATAELVPLLIGHIGACCCDLLSVLYSSLLTSMCQFLYWTVTYCHIIWFCTIIGVLLYMVSIHTRPFQSVISPLLTCDHFCCSRWISVTQHCQQLAATVTSPTYLLQTSFYSSSCPHWTTEVLTAWVQNTVLSIFLEAETCMHGLSTLL
jgi:hypothetical protein